VAEVMHPTMRAGADTGNAGARPLWRGRAPREAEDD
jgi:hypothetical protein